MIDSVKVLAVDDLKMNLEMLQIMLTGVADDYLTASNGKEALELLAHHPDTDVILLDLEMPVMNGLEMLKQVKRDDRFRDIPVIVVSSGHTEVLSSLALGANDFVARPYNSDELRLRIQNQLRAKKLQDLSRSMSSVLEREVVKKTSQLRKALEYSRRTEFEISLRLGKAAEFRDVETGMHIRRISEFSNLLAELAGLSEKACETIRYASPLHDVGKIGIPDRILLKPGELDASEFEVMKLHTVIGGKILAAEETYPVIAAGRVIALQHHEKWDGTGYPHGLAGAQIHIFGRIVMIVDIYDALRSDRPYKKSFSVEKTVRMMAEREGTFFDPRLIGLFMDNLDAFERIRTDLEDAAPDPAAADFPFVV